MEGRFTLTAAAFTTAVALITATPAMAAVELIDGNTRTLIDTEDGDGQFFWSVKGNTNHVFQQWFAIRAGDMTDELFLNDTDFSKGADFLSDTDGDGFDDNLNVSYSHALGFDVQLNLKLTGSAGGNTGDLAETILITNTSGRSLNFSFFQYADFDLGGSLGGDEGFFEAASKVVQSQGGTVLQETTAIPNANRRQMSAPFSAIFGDGDIDDLADANTAPFPTATVGPQDVAWAFQWNFSLADGGSFSISKDKLLTVPGPLALPAGLALLGVMGLGCGRRRRTA